MKTSKIRKSAKGEACCLQIHPYCNGNPETTVLAHLPSQHHGIALKSPDWWAVYSCSGCHDVIDSRNPQAVRDLGWNEINLCIMRGLYRTQKRLIEKDLMKVAA